MSVNTSLSKKIFERRWFKLIRRGGGMKKAHLSQREISERFDLKIFDGLLLNAGKAVFALNEEEKDPIKQLNYIFRVLENYFEKVVKNLEAYRSEHGSVAMSNPYQKELFMAFCLAIGVIGDQEKLKFYENIQKSKKINEKLLKITNEMYHDVKNAEKNGLNFYAMRKKVIQACRLIDQSLKEVKDVDLKKASLLANEEIIYSLLEMKLIELVMEQIPEKAQKLKSRLHAKEKGEFYFSQVDRCINILEKTDELIFREEFTKDQDNDKYLIMKHLIDLTIELMSEYYNEMKKEFFHQDSGKMDEREVGYLENILNTLVEMKNGAKGEMPHLEELPTFSKYKYTQAFTSFLDAMNSLSLEEEKKPRLSP